MSVNAWVEKVAIPTYETGKPEKNPMFLEKRVYQGSSGVVYPFPVIESIGENKTLKEYQAVFLENEYLKIMILPELGGRIQRAYDKIRNRDFVYYNEVIKPALVGLAGPWISGGIEFNWPQHHRPSTFSPVDFTIEKYEDGSITVWVNETEIMSRTKGMAGFTLYPGKAYLEVKGQLFNGTPFPQSFLWWANPAVKVNDDYQSVFPQDVSAVFDHGKRDVSDFPIATGTYYRVNYAPGTDISRFRNIPVPTSFMAIESKYDFMGCYENDTQSGMLHVANHHVSPGKKQWTWGNGNFGSAWYNQLTDENGPYIELMTGVYTDNQPDFSWLNPNESKTFRQYFFPYADIGYVKNATKDAAINVDRVSNNLRVRIFVTSVYENTVVLLSIEGKPFEKILTDLSPLKLFNQVFRLPGTREDSAWEISVSDQHGNVLVSFDSNPERISSIPAPATAAKHPSEIEQVEELFLNGLHLEQYRHATFSALDYYEEGLRRSPGDVRCNNGKGLYLLRRGKFSEAEPYFRTAIQTLTKRNPNPYDGEAYYNLGLSLWFQEKLNDAYNAFYKASWNDALQHNAFLWLARIAVLQGRFSEGLELIDKSIVRSFHSNTSRHLKAVLLRKQNFLQQCVDLCVESISIDPFNFGCVYEKILVESILQQKQLTSELQEMFSLMRYAENNILELALQYMLTGCFGDAILLLTTYLTECGKLQDAEPRTLVYYYLGCCHQKCGNPENALKYYQTAAGSESEIVFPNKIEEIAILQDAIAANPADGKACYYLGNLWYDKRQYEDAIAYWQAAVKVAPDFPTSYRNLALAFYNKRKDSHQALVYLSKAFDLDRTDARVLMELDQLNKAMNMSPAERLRLLEDHVQLTEQRDDLYLERVTLYNNLNNYSKARELLGRRKFQPWEGGEGKVTRQYLLCHTELARHAIISHRFDEALKLLAEVREYPENLGEGKLSGVQENDLDYLTGCALEGIGEQDEANRFFKKATLGASDFVQAVYYNDPQPDNIFYQALAWIALEEPEKAINLFQNFIDFGEKHITDNIRIDYFAVSLPDMLVFDVDLNQRNIQHCNYLIGLGYIGLGYFEKGIDHLDKVLRSDNSHQGALISLQLVNFLKEKSAKRRFASLSKN